MLDPAILKDNIEDFKLNISRRDLKIDVNLLISLNDERKSLRFDAEQKRSQQKCTWGGQNAPPPPWATKG